VNYVLDADIRGFFDAIDHQWMERFLEHRIADPRVLRLIRKWLRAGVSEEGQWSKTTVGTPQGSVLTPPTILQKTGLLWTTSSPGPGCGRVMGRVGRRRNVSCSGRLRQGCPVRRSQPWRVPLRFQCGG
jgi:hypothetical protein